MAKVKKAIAAFVVAGLGTLATGLPDGLTSAEIGAAVGVAVAAALAVYGVKNAPAQ